MKYLALVVALSAFACTAAQCALADQWSYLNFPTTIGTPPIAPVNVFLSPTTGACTSAVANVGSPSCPGAAVPTPGSINLNQFANEADVVSLQAQVSALQTSFQTQLLQLQHTALQASAMAAALTPMMPTNGNFNHLGLGMATVGNHQAVSVNYTRLVDDFDIEAAVSATGNQALGKIGFGFSW